MTRARRTAPEADADRQSRKGRANGQSPDNPTDGGENGAGETPGDGEGAGADADPFLSFREQPVAIERDLERDLFGEPIRPGAGQPGRPPHLPTAESRARVLELRKTGATQDEIGAALGVTGPTLRLNYAAELGSRSQTWRRRAAKMKGQKHE